MDPARSPPGLPARPLLSENGAEAVLAAVLAAHRAGSLGEAMRQRPRMTRWLVRRYLAPVLAARGQFQPDERAVAGATAVLLRWALAALRPDQAAGLDDIDADAWLDRTSWRPLLALACHCGLLGVPDFPGRYRRSADEGATDNLCGLWNVGSSTFYRYLDKGRRQLADLLADRGRLARSRQSLRAAALASLQGEPPWNPDGRADWHQAQAARALAEHDPASALWHLLQAREAQRFVAVLMRHRVELSAEEETDAMIEACAGLPLSRRALFDLRLAHAALWLTRSNHARALACYEQALRQAGEPAPDPLLLGMALGALGKFHESRDRDKALACFQDSAEHLREAAGRPEAGEALAEYVGALQRLAWHYVMRNDPRSRVVLEQAESLKGPAGLSDETVALLEQAWGEYWRRAGDFRRAVEHHHRVLNVFERLGDRRQILSTFNNLSLIYVEAGNFDRAIDYAQRVRTAAQAAPVEPYLLASALGNLGIALFSLGRHDEAIEAYASGLRCSVQANLPVIANRARFNLAEAHYRRFRERGDPADEEAGDRHIAASMAAAEHERDAQIQAAAPGLKAEILGDARGLVHERLWPGEAVEHYDEMREVQRQRAVLALPATPRDRVRAHLAIANAYLAVSTKERETALGLIREHDLGDEFDAEIDALRMTFSRELTREKVLLAQWKQKSYGVLTEERASTVLRQVLQGGSINKSGYAQLCQVGLATASKHLGTLAERGLLVQVGKGPSTRYVLP